MSQSKQITLRFKEVIDQLVSHKDIELENMYSMSCLAKLMRTTVDQIHNYRQGVDFIPMDQAFRFAAKYDCEDFIFAGVSGYLEETSFKGGNILHIPWEVQAGDFSFDDLLKKGDRYSKAGITGEAYSFSIKGTSMTPNLLPEDCVFTRRVFKPEEMTEEKVYVIFTNEKQIVKRLKIKVMENEKVKELIFLSDNITEYPKPIILSIKEGVNFIFEVFHMERNL